MSTLINKRSGSDENDYLNVGVQSAIVDFFFLPASLVLFVSFMDGCSAVMKLYISTSISILAG